MTKAQGLHVSTPRKLPHRRTLRVQGGAVLIAVALSVGYTSQLDVDEKPNPGHSKTNKELADVTFALWRPALKRLLHRAQPESQTSEGAGRHPSKLPTAGSQDGRVASRIRDQRIGMQQLAVLALPVSLTGRLAGAAVLVLIVTVYMKVKHWLETPSRPYETTEDKCTVGNEYDKWTREGVLEHYWGEHIHMGSYLSPKAKNGFCCQWDFFIPAFIRATLTLLMGRLKDFKEAKLDFSEEMLLWSGARNPKKILDVGCGIGGTSRYLAKRFPDAEVQGITLSPEQVARATELAKEAGLTNVKFEVHDALNMTFEDNSYDLVWGCESGEHMPDKTKYVEEMSRVLKPGGNLVIATWCERDPIPPFTLKEHKQLDFVYKEWRHPYFISISDYEKRLNATGLLERVDTADWTKQTLPSWRHSIWVGVWSPWYWIKCSMKDYRQFLGFVRDAYTLEQYHRAMRSGLLQYGMMRAVKKVPKEETAPELEEAVPA